MYINDKMNYYLHYIQELFVIEDPNLLSSNSFSSKPPCLFFSRAMMSSEITAEAKFKQKMKKRRIKFMSKANTKENAPLEI